MTHNHLGDALHIACAAVHHVDFFISWDVTDIVNYNLIMNYNAVNVNKGYNRLLIDTPARLGNKKKNRQFDCVEMTRNYRNRLYEKDKDLTIDDFTKCMITEAHKSPLWKKLIIH